MQYLLVVLNPTYIRVCLP